MFDRQCACALEHIFLLVVCPFCFLFPFPILQIILVSFTVFSLLFTIPVSQRILLFGCWFLQIIKKLFGLMMGKDLRMKFLFTFYFSTLFHLQILYSSLVWLFQSNNSNLLFRRHNNVYFFKNHSVSLSMDSLLLFLSNIYNYHPLTHFLFNL